MATGLPRRTAEPVPETRNRLRFPVVHHLRPTGVTLIV